jgi:hypothetical protein
MLASMIPGTEGRRERRPRPPPQLRLRPVLAAIAATALLAPRPAPAGRDEIRACGADRRATRVERGECLARTGDPRAISAIHALAREVMAEEGRQAGARDELWDLARAAGRLAAWTDASLLVGLTRSPDARDRLFAAVGLKHLLRELRLGTANGASERAERFTRVRTQVRGACRSLADSDDELVRDAAGDCVEESDRQRAHVEPRRAMGPHGPRRRSREVSWRRHRVDSGDRFERSAPAAARDLPENWSCP